MRVTLLALAVCAGCHAAPPEVPLPPCDDSPTPDGGYIAGMVHPLAIVGDRASDRLSLFSILPQLAPAGCLSVDENPTFLDEPFDLALAPAADVFYLVLGHAQANVQGTLLKIRLSDGAKLAEVPVGDQPAMVVLSHDGSRAYVTLFRNLTQPEGPWSEPGGLVVVDTASMKVLGEADVCGAGLGVALDEPRSRAFVACLGGNAVAEVDVSGAPTLTRTLPLDDGKGNLGMGAAYLALDGKHLFATAQTSGDLWIWDLASTTFVSRIDLGSSGFPQRMAFTPDGSLLLVAVDFANQLAAVSTSALEIFDRVLLPGTQTQGIAVSGDGKWALVTDETDLQSPGRLVRVDLAGLGTGGAKKVDSVETADFPQAVVIVP